jgi:23S rRNA (cytosine1962-C5)-methyltransferase
MPKEEFMEMLKDAAQDAGVSIRIIEIRGASFDHPVLPSVNETEYLKFVLLQII